MFIGYWWGGWEVEAVGVRVFFFFFFLGNKRQGKYIGGRSFLCACCMCPKRRG